MLWVDGWNGVCCVLVHSLSAVVLLFPTPRVVYRAVNGESRQLADQGEKFRDKNEIELKLYDRIMQNLVSTTFDCELTIFTTIFSIDYFIPFGGRLSLLMPIQLYMGERRVSIWGLRGTSYYRLYNTNQHSCQVLVHKVFRKMLNLFIFVYLDDIPIFSRNQVELIHYVPVDLQKKCEFHAPSVPSQPPSIFHFLEYIEEHGSVQMD